MRMRKLLPLLALISALLCFFACAQAAEYSAANRDAVFQEGGIPETRNVSGMVRASSGVEALLYRELLAESQSIDIEAYNLSLDAFKSIYYEVINSHGDLFFVESGFSYYSKTVDGVKYVTDLLPNYRYTGEDRAEKSRAYNAEIERIAAYASKASTDLGKALMVNDYFCLNYQYDTDYAIYDAYNLFTQKKGVCQAYMLGYRAAMEKLGITNLSVSSAAMNHTWNSVRIDGAWYNVDVTWNDPTKDRPGRARHEYFMFSDGARSDHYDYTAPVAAASTKYDDFFWTDVDTAIPVSGAEFYYIDASSQGSLPHSVCKWTQGGASGVLHTFAARWSAGGGGYYVGYYGFFGMYGSRLYFTDSVSVYSVGLDGSGARLEYSPDIGGEYLYGGYVLDGTLYYLIASSPSASGALRSWLITRNLPSQVTVSPVSVCLTPGETAAFTAALVPADALCALTWTIEDSHIARVDQTGLVMALYEGETIVTVTTENGLTASAEVRVILADALNLPDDTSFIGAEAFAGGAFRCVLMGTSVTEISSRAFALCVNLECVVISGADTLIADDAFAGCRADLMFICPENSDAREYAVRMGYPVSPIR